MDKKTVLKIISDFETALKGENINSEKIVLFGSYSDGSFHDGSDIDLVVISDDFHGKGYWERLEILTSAVYKVFMPIEAVAVTNEEWQKGNSMVIDFAKDGEIVYSKN